MKLKECICYVNELKKRIKDRDKIIEDKNKQINKLIIIAEEAFRNNLVSKSFFKEATKK